MTGITSYGAYIPLHRLSRAEICKAWGENPLPGEKAVANYDEDSITMAVAASMDCIKGVDPYTIDGLYFASTTSPYREKQSTPIIAGALDLRRDIFAADFSNSLRSGTEAVRAAIDAINGGSAKSVLVCAADVRLGFPHGEKELNCGDGAGALLLGNTGVIANLEGTYTVTDEIIDVWRSDKDIFVRSWEERFGREAGYVKVVSETVFSALKRYSLTARDFSKAVFYAPDARTLNITARKLGFDLKAQVQDPLYSVVGNTGTALSFMLLVAALEEAKPGDRILWVSYGDGCDVYILRVTKEIENVRDRRGIKGHLESKRMLPSYQKYLRWREIIPVEPPARPPLEQPAAPALWRDRKGGLALYGVRCKRCGTPQYPAQRVCVKCQAKDEFEDYRFANKKGVVFTFSQDNLAVAMDPPSTCAAIDFEDGGRIMCDITDRDPQEVKVGMPVEMTFRKLHYVGNFYNYWWKCQPIRC